MEIKNNVKIIKESNGSTDKLQGISHISCNTTGNKFCDSMRKLAKENNTACICRHCYAVGASRYNGKDDKWNLEYTGQLLSSRILTKKEIMENCVSSNILLRISKYGELININHLINIMNIAKVNKHAKVSLFTKRADLVIEYAKLNKIPSNVILIYSNPIIDGVVTNEKILNTFHKVFNVISKDLNRVNCNDKNSNSTKCIVCRKCYKKTGVKDIFEGLRK